MKEEQSNKLNKRARDARNSQVYLLVSLKNIFVINFFFIPSKVKV